jgi:hypothetical protein
MSFDILNDIITPIRGGAAVVLGAELPVGVRALWVGTGGDVVVTTRLGSTFTLANVSDGTLLPVHAQTVGLATSAADIVALY